MLMQRGPPRPRDSSCLLYTSPQNEAEADDDGLVDLDADAGEGVNGGCLLYTSPWQPGVCGW